MKSMSLRACVALFAALAAPAAMLAAPAMCGPDPDGRIAQVFYDGRGISWEPIVRYEYARATLTINGPCEEIIKTFKPGEPIQFDIAEIERVLDGRYTWQLQLTPAIDPGVKKELEAARGSGKEDDIWWSFWTAGKIVGDASIESAAFSVVDGAIIDPASGEEGTGSGKVALGPRGASGAVSGGHSSGLALASSNGAGEASGGPTLGTRDFVINDDLIVDGSACIGFDCVNGEVFSFDTIRLKENNLRIKFDDTSVVPSFPANDWQLTANESANGGASKFSIEDVSNSRTPFTVEANARSHSLYVDDGGRIGIRTSTPSVEIHVIDGDTPTLRLQQDGSSGFEPQTWDVAGNETNFFVRDVTNGSTLPLRIRPSAPSNSIFVDVDGDVGMGTSAPGGDLHVIGTGNPAFLFESANQNAMIVESTAGTNTAFLFIENAGLAGDFNNVAVGSSNDDLVLRAGDSTKMLVGGGGNVVIGQTTEQDHDFEIHTGATFSEIDAGEAQFTTSSSRSLKTNITPVQAADILDRVAGVGVYTYDFIDGPDDKIGLMAEDFHAVFGRGSDKLLNGHEVQMALWLAVRELTARNQALTDANAGLSQANAQLGDRLEAVERALAALREAPTP